MKKIIVGSLLAGSLLFANNSAQININSDTLEVIGSYSLNDSYDLNDPHQKRQAIESVTELIAHIVSEIERDEWIGKCADEFDVSERVIMNAVKKQIEDLNSQGSNIQYIKDDVVPENISTAQQSQMQRIYKSIILMMMAYPHVWEYVYKNKDRYGEVMNQRMIKALIREGPECGFSVGAFVSKNNQREKLYTAAMQMQQKYEREHEKNWRSRGTVYQSPLLKNPKVKKDCKWLTLFPLSGHRPLSGPQVWRCLRTRSYPLFPRRSSRASWALSSFPRSL